MFSAVGNRPVLFKSNGGTIHCSFMPASCATKHKQIKKHGQFAVLVFFFLEHFGIGGNQDPEFHSLLPLLTGL